MAVVARYLVDKSALARARHPYERLPMPDEVWDQAAATQRELARSGRTRVAGIPDLLIAASAARAGVAVLHLVGHGQALVIIGGGAARHFALGPS